jgi:wobble nucleotide-excising tRNase
MSPVIKSFKRLRGLGVFADHTPAADLPEFRRYNLIYGFNASGKTTLSRVLRCLERGASDGEFAVSFDDGKTITHESTRGTPSSNVAVFNIDFIDENLRWREGRASPVFFIGNEQARLAELVERLTPRLAARAAAENRAAIHKDRATTAFANFKREKARLVSEELGLGRRYTAPSLDQDMSGFAPIEGMLLSEEQLRQKKSLYYSTSAGTPIVEIPPLPDGVLDYLTRVQSHCATTFSGAVIEALREHAGMLKWAKDGLDYHESHSLSDCLFCGNSLTAERLDQLGKSIDDRFTRTVEETNRLQAERGTRLDTLDAWWGKIPANSALEVSLSEAYEAQRLDLDRHKELLRSRRIS